MGSKTSQLRKSSLNHIYVAFLRSCMALFFLGVGLSKLVGHEGFHIMFIQYGYSEWLMYLVGVAEVLAAAGLLFNRTRFIATGIILTIMMGATSTHILNQEYTLLALTVAIMGVSLKLIIEFYSDTEEILDNFHMDYKHDFETEHEIERNQNYDYDPSSSEAKDKAA